jgi:hypothetical protein
VLRRGSWRTTKAHEYVFLLAKSPDYFADGEAVREAAGQPLGAPELTAQHKRERYLGEPAVATGVAA